MRSYAKTVQQAYYNLKYLVQNCVQTITQKNSIIGYLKRIQCYFFAKYL